MLSEKERMLIAFALICRLDAVSLCTCSEVRKIRDAALAGKFDDMLNILFTETVETK